KNWQHVSVVTDPADYPALVAEMQSSGGAISIETRFRLARKAFSHTAAYDGAISNYLTATDIKGARGDFPEQFNASFARLQDLRSGKNPPQRAAFYRARQPRPGSIAICTKLQAKELSYNNIADSAAAWEGVKPFDAPACVIVKHANPCGVAIAGASAEA